MPIAPVVQWMNSMYFVLMVFATVAFGIISVTMMGKVVYAASTLLIGTIANCTTIGIVIAIVTSSSPGS